MSTLLLRLSAPLQSWGLESKYDSRRTYFMPTKSGVIGMLAAALGRKREASLDDLCKLRFGVRIDAAGTIIEDFQITNMGEKLNVNISRRQYLSDALFVVGLESDDTEYLKALAQALMHPVFPIYLGRRSCPPTQPIVLSISNEELYVSLRNTPWQVSDYMKSKVGNVLRIIIEGDGRAISRDVPVSFSGKKRKYVYRESKEMSPRIIDMTDLRFVEMTQHDPMKELR